MANQELTYGLGPTIVPAGIAVEPAAEVTPGGGEMAPGPAATPGAEAIRRLFCTFMTPPEMRTMFSAILASSGDATVPLSTTAFPLVEIRIRCGAAIPEDRAMTACKSGNRVASAIGRLNAPNLADITGPRRPMAGPNTLLPV